MNEKSPMPFLSYLPLLGGVLAALFYYLSIYGGFFSLLMGYVPLVPLFVVGLSMGARHAAVSAAFAAIVAAAFSGLGGVLGFVLLYAAPVIFFCHAVLTILPKSQAFPVGGALTGLSLYGAVIIAAFASSVVDPLTGASSLLQAAEPLAEDSWLAPAQQMLESHPFFVFGLIGWVQILMVYAAAILANFILASYDREIRNTLRLTPFMPSLFILATMLIAGLMTFSESLNWQVAGKSAFIVLLLPYFLMGVAQLHLRARAWKHATLWLFIIYSTTMLVFWPVFWFIGTGIVEQAKFLSNRS